MKITIGAYDKETGTVPVKFEHGDVVHDRAVNACLNAQGEYDAEATAARVDEVARGVEYKIAAGAIKAPEPEAMEAKAPPKSA